MGDKKNKKKDKSSEKSKDAAGAFESLGRQLDDIPQVRAARQAVERAGERLREVAERYRHSGEQAAEDRHGDNRDGDDRNDEREATLGEVAEDVLRYVRRHPAQGIVAAGLLGFVLGRLFRR